MTWVAAGLTAAEIAAAEAAMIAATEAAATAAATAAAETAATTAAADAALAAAPEVLATAAPEALGILEAVPTAVEAGAPAGVPTTVPGAMPAAPVGIEQAVPAAPAETLQFANAPTATSDVAQYSQDQQILDMMKNYKPGAETQLSPEVLQASGNVPTTTAPASEGIANFRVPSAGVEPTGYGINAVPPAPASNAYISSPTYNPNVSYSSQVQSPYNMTNLPSPDVAQGIPSVPTYEVPESGLSKGFNDALSWMDKNPFKTGLLAYTGLNLMGAFDPASGGGMPQKKYSGSLSNYRMSPNFQPSRATPSVYTPRYAAEGGIMMAAGGSYDDEPAGDVPGMASGGIASYARGRQVSSQEELQDYLSMMEAQQAKPAPDPSYVGNVGLMYDTDPDTRYKDALTASMIRMGKVNKKATYSPYKNMQRPNAMGGINLSAPGMKKAEAASGSDDEREAAAGGIMQADRYNMGGYASGSVPRLLKGPGDGMSDNIPATIDGRQPARLADGEFVIPADVVSHLGNGSTEAGAKHLHKMMTDVRKARTGNPKQGKQIKASKFMPKKGK